MEESKINLNATVGTNIAALEKESKDIQLQVQHRRRRRTLLFPMRAKICHASLVTLSQQQRKLKRMTNWTIVNAERLRLLSKQVRHLTK